MGGGVLHVHKAQQCGCGRAGAAQLPTTVLTHAVCVLYQPLTRQTHRGPGLPHALNPLGWPYRLCLLYQVLGQITHPTRDFLFFCLGLCVHLSLFMYLCAVCLLTYLLIHYLLMDEKCCSYQFTHLLSVVSCPACRGPRIPLECSLAYLPLWNSRECWG